MELSEIHFIFEVSSLSLKQREAEKIDGDINEFIHLNVPSKFALPICLAQSPTVSLSLQSAV